MRTFLRYSLYCIGTFFTSIVMIWGSLYVIGLAMLGGFGDDYNLKEDGFGKTILASLIISIISWIAIFKLEKGKQVP